MTSTKKRTLRLGDRTFEVELAETAPGTFVVRSGEREAELTVQHLGHGALRILRSGASPLLATTRREGTGSWVHIDGETFQFVEETAGGGRRAKRQHATGSLDAPMPGKVVRVEVEAGAQVRAGETILILEAMKMEHSLRAPKDGVLKAVHVKAGDMVASGQALAEVDGHPEGEQLLAPRFPSPHRESHFLSPLRAFAAIPDASRM